MQPGTRRLLKAAVSSELSGRKDARVLSPVLLTMLQTALNDFNRYYDSRHAANRVSDHDILMARAKAAKEAPTR